MTKPFVLAKEVKSVGRAVPTPWASFGFVARASWLAEAANREALAAAAAVAAFEASALLRDPADAAAEISATFHLSAADAGAWLSRVRYCTGPLCAVAPMLRLVLRALVGVAVLADTSAAAPARAAAGGYDLGAIVDERAAPLADARAPPAAEPEVTPDGAPAPVPASAFDDAVPPWWAALQPAVGLAADGSDGGASDGGGSGGARARARSRSRRSSFAASRAGGSVGGGGAGGGAREGDFEAESLAPSPVQARPKALLPAETAAHAEWRRGKEDALAATLAHLGRYGGAVSAAVPGRAARVVAHSAVPAALGAGGAGGRAPWAGALHDIG